MTDLFHGWIEPARYGRTFHARAPADAAALDLLSNHIEVPVSAEVLDQGPIGSCVVQACALGAEALATRSKTVPERPSRRWLYYKAREAIGTVDEDSGSIAGDALVALRAGWVPEAKYPHNHDWATWLATPPEPREDAPFLLNSEALPNDVPTVLFELAQGSLVVAGLRIDAGWEAPGEFLAGPAGSPKGGHCVLIRGYQRAGRDVVVLVRNSWSAAWGKGGEAWMPAEWLSIAHCGELHAMRVVRNPASRR